MNIKRLLTALLLATALHANAASDETSKDNSKASTEKAESRKTRRSILQVLSQPFRWIGKNWSAYDENYSTPSFYNWAFQMQNATSGEWINMGYDDISLHMRSKISNKIGPYLYYTFLGYGFAIDLNALTGTKRRSEFTLSINSNLMNIDLIRRRTGGDFMVNHLDIAGVSNSDFDLDELAANYHVGDDVRYNVTGININVFTNHKKYSNPAAFSNGAIQLRSVGSPIVGLGYTHQEIKNSISNTFLDYRAKRMGYEKFDGSSDLLLKMLIDEDDYVDMPTAAILQATIPSYLSVKDLHLQLGYAQNIVFSRRLLLGLSLVASPGIKWVKADNHSSYQYIFRDGTAMVTDYCLPFLKKYIQDGTLVISNKKYRDYILNLKQVTPDLYDIESKTTSFGTNLHARASITYNYNRWRFGVNANASGYLYKKNLLRFNNFYGSVMAYAGYCFGRKKAYRYGGEKREAYIRAALTKSEIAATRDLNPASNVAPASGDKSGVDSLGSVKSGAVVKHRTKYFTDKFDFNIEGCDLVMGPDGTYGSYEITDGFVTNADDSEGLLRQGTKLAVDEDGTIIIRAPHNSGYRAANWWKARLTTRQNSRNRDPELLHYALCGKLTLYVRSHNFGTMRPVPLVVGSFYISHGKVNKSYYEIGAKHFMSYSTASIMGHINVNGRLTRVYIESRRGGKHFNLYAVPMRASTLNWMAHVSDTCRISRISIPGTHDAGSASLKETTMASAGHTQNFPVSEQMADGIRAFDFRLKKNMKFGHTIICRDGIHETIQDMAEFLRRNPSEFLVAIIGSDEGGSNWPAGMADSLSMELAPYRDLIVEDFSAATRLKDVRGKILFIKRQEACPVGKYLPFQDNTTFVANGFHVEDVYKEHKTYRKIKIVERHIREAYENDNSNLWYITFNSIAWDPRHHKPYYSAWGARNVRKPMNRSLREIIELKAYSRFGMVFLDFYNDHGDQPQLVSSIIMSNFNINQVEDYIPAP